MHLAKVTDRKLPTPKPLDEVREQIIEEMDALAKDEKIKAHVEVLKEKAEIIDTPDNPEDEFL